MLIGRMGDAAGHGAAKRASENGIKNKAYAHELLSVCKEDAPRTEMEKMTDPTGALRGR